MAKDPQTVSLPEKKLRFWNRLRFKMSLGIVLILGFILILIGKIAIQKQQKYMMEQLQDYGREVAGFVAETSIVPIRKFSVYQLESFAEHLEKGQLITYCEIYDHKGNPLAHLPGKKDQLKSNTPEKTKIFSTDIIDDGEVIGRVELGVNAGPLMERMDKTSLYIQWAFVLELVIIALAVGVFVHRVFVSPFLRLTRITEEISAGKFTTSGQASRNDEIGGLAKSINRMSDKLRESYQNLEKKVAERTEKLEESNKKLESSVGTLAVRNREISLFNKCIEELQLCDTKEDTFPILFETCRQLFPQSGGTLTRVGSESGTFSIVGAWGNQSGTGIRSGTLTDECWAVKNRKAHLCYNPEESLTCRHNSHTPGSAFCLPIIVQGDMFGALHIVMECGNVEQFMTLQKLAENLIRQYSLFLNNLQLRDTLRLQSVCDPLTGLFNRRFMEETLKREGARARREKFTIGIIMLDVDHFKKFNDNYGHDMGDTILKKLAEILESSIRREDVVCRYGGEEFILILPNTAYKNTMSRAEKIRSLIEQKLTIDLLDDEVNITVSAGVAVYDTHQESIESVIIAADKALYQAKSQGRNRVCSIEPHESPSSGYSHL